MFRKLLMIWVLMMLIIVLAATIMTMSCQDREDAKEISLEGERVSYPSAKEDMERSLCVAIAVLVSPKDTYGYYKDIFKYLSKKLDIPVTIAHRTTEHECRELISTGGFDIALTCSMVYISHHDKGEVELLAVPQINNKTTCRTYIIVPADSPATSFEDLRNKNFCFTSHRCVVGYLLPVRMLARQGEMPESFFKHYGFTKSHVDTIEAVARNIVDGGAVSSLIWEYFNHKNPELASRTKVIGKSIAISNPPLVVRPDMDKNLKDKIKETLFSMHQDINGRKILDSLMIDKFVDVKDSAYDTICTIKESVDPDKY